MDSMKILSVSPDEAKFQARIRSGGGNANVITIPKAIKDAGDWGTGVVVEVVLRRKIETN